MKPVDEPPADVVETALSSFENPAGAKADSVETIGPRLKMHLLNQLQNRH